MTANILSMLSGLLGNFGSEDSSDSECSYIDNDSSNCCSTSSTSKLDTNSLSSRMEVEKDLLNKALSGQPLTAEDKQNAQKLKETCPICEALNINI